MKKKDERVVPTDEFGRKAVIDINNITKIYKMGDIEVPALRGVSLRVYEGEFISIMGPSGSGKSTMLQILGALDQPTSGEYYLDGVNVASLRDADLAIIRNKKIGFVFQSFNLLKRTSALRQVELPLIYAGARERGKRAKAALEAVGLGQRLNHLPSELSGGQQQRVAIARALVSNPKLILADEPTGNLDTANGDAVMELLTGVAKAGTTVLMVTHSLAYAGFAQRTIKLLDGRVVSETSLAA